MYEEHRASDILSTAEPDSDQAWNANEVGFDPKWRWQRVLTSSKEQRLFRTTTGEKAPLLVTAWLWTRADGRCFIPPSLIHQRQGSRLSEIQALGLQSDWIVHATPSGYQDRDGFLKVCTEFVEYCGLSNHSMYSLMGMILISIARLLTFLLRSTSMYSS